MKENFRPDNETPHAIATRLAKLEKEHKRVLGELKISNRSVFAKNPPYRKRVVRKKGRKSS